MYNLQSLDVVQMVLAFAPAVVIVASTLYVAVAFDRGSIRYAPLVLGILWMVADTLGLLWAYGVGPVRTGVMEILIFQFGALSVATLVIYPFTRAVTDFYWARTPS